MNTYVIALGCSRGRWRMQLMCGCGSDATVCRRLTLRSAKCSLWVIHRKWWELLMSRRYLRFHLFAFLQWWLLLVFFLAGVVWSCTSLPIKLRLLAGELQLDHPVSPREGVLCVWLISTHHTSSGRPAGLMLHHFKVYWAQPLKLFSWAEWFLSYFGAVYRTNWQNESGRVVSARAAKPRRYWFLLRCQLVIEGPAEVVKCRLWGRKFKFEGIEDKTVTI